MSTLLPAHEEDPQRECLQQAHHYFLHRVRYLNYRQGQHLAEDVDYGAPHK